MFYLWQSMGIVTLKTLLSTDTAESLSVVTAPAGMGGGPFYIQ